MLTIAVLLVLAAIAVNFVVLDGQRIPRFVSPLLWIAGVFTGAASTVTVVDAGHRGVQITFGNVNEQALPEGLHFVNPLSSVIEMEARVQREQETHPAETSDTQSVKITVITNWRPRGESMAWLYQNYGAGYADKIIPPAIREAVKAEIAKYKVTELVAQRPNIHSAVQSSVNTWLNKYNLDVLEVAIGDIDFSDKYDDAIEAKQVQEQQALQKKYELDRTVTEAQMAEAKAKGEADSKIAEAKGAAESVKLAAQAEAESLRIRGEAQAEFNRRLAESLTPTLIQSQWMQRWDGKLPVYQMGEGGAAMLLPMPLAGK